jgi:uncharacterized protein YbaR (Trm112 family)
MKHRLLQWLACPVCRGALALTDPKSSDDEIEAGVLRCDGCDRGYPIVRGIPRLLPPALSHDAETTGERFAYEWTRYDEIRAEYEPQFLGWTAPFDPSGFAERLVVDAGCGKGRHLRVAARFGARDVIGIDVGPAIDVSARNTRDLVAVHVVQGDLEQPPLRPGVADVVYSIGVLHHLADPAAGFRSLASLVRPGGTLIAWVYAREGNERLLTVLEPIRRVTRRLPLAAVQAIAWPAAVAVTAVVRGVYAPAASRPRILRALPYASYLADLSRFPIREVQSIVFDQLLAPVAHYMARTEVERAVRDSGLELRTLTWHHRNSWSVVTTRPPTDRPDREAT